MRISVRSTRYHLQQIAATSTEAKQMATQRVAMQNLLDLQGQ
jgi:hypothetical protein